jgi:hypothetical protein
MRLFFRTVLPVAQAAIAIALITSPPKFRTVIGPVDAYYPPPSLPTGVIRFAEMNLPAVPIIAPLYVLSGGREGANTQWLIAAFGSAAIGIWFFVGQFLDDVVAAWRKRLSPRRRVPDRLFFAFVIASACLVFFEAEVASIALSLDRPLVMVAALCWAAFGWKALVAQARWARKAGT